MRAVDSRMIAKYSSFVRSADVQTDLSVDVTDARNDSVPAKDGDNVELWPIPKRPRCVGTSAG
jgi:hypothetical protein